MRKKGGQLRTIMLWREIGNLKVVRGNFINLNNIYYYELQANIHQICY